MDPKIFVICAAGENFEKFGRSLSQKFFFFCAAGENFERSLSQKSFFGNSSDETPPPPPPFSFLFYLSYISCSRNTKFWIPQTFRYDHLNSVYDYDFSNIPSSLSAFWLSSFDNALAKYLLTEFTRRSLTENFLD